MKNKIYIIAFTILTCIMFSCDEDDTIIIEEAQPVTIAQFLGSSERYSAFLEAANASVIPFDLADRYGLSPLQLDPNNGLAVRSLGEDGGLNDYYSVLDLLSIEDADFTVFVPNLSANDAVGFSIDVSNLVSIDPNFTNEERITRRAEIGNVLLYHMLEGKRRLDELECAEIPLSSNGEDEIGVANITDLDTGEPSLTLGNATVGSIRDLEQNLSNGFFNLINTVLEVTTATPIPIPVGFFANERENGNITIRFSRKLDEESVNNTPPSSFTIMADGDNIPVSSVSIDPEDGTTVIVEPSINLSNKLTDVTIDYTGNSILSGLQGSASTFENLLVRLNVERLFSISTDFENDDSVRSGYRIPRPLSDRSSEQAFRGSFSLRVSNVNVGSITDELPTGEFGEAIYVPGRLRTNADFSPVNTLDPTGVYRLEYALFIEDLPVLDATNPVNFEFRVQRVPGGVLRNPIINVAEDESALSIEDRKKGKWHFIKVDIPAEDFVLTPAQYRFVIVNNDVLEPNPYLFYIDDIRMYRLED